MKSYIFALFFFVFGMNCFALESQQSQTGRAEFIATMFHKYIHNKSFASLYSDLSKALPKDEITFLKGDLIKNNSIISSKVNGSEVVVNGTLRITFRDDGSVLFGSKKKNFAYDGTKSFKENYETVRNLLEVRTSLYSLFIRDANAFFEPITLAFTIAAAGAVVVVGTVVLVGNEIIQEIKDGTVVCDGDSFIFRTKSRNAIKWASTESTLLKPTDASRILNETVERCNDETAKNLEKKIVKNFEVDAKNAAEEVKKAQQRKDGLNKKDQVIKSIGTQ